ncbi:unnamed protein product, partial [marine sediment metagenome]
MDITAVSGHAQEIQKAVDLASTGDNVHIPAGTYNFYEAGESWTPVEIPAGINIYGALSRRNDKGQVIEWETVLLMPEEAPPNSIWFKYTINDNLPLRFTDIKLVGFRYFNPESIRRYIALKIFAPYRNYPVVGVLNFRVDHCNFQDIAGSAVNFGDESEYNRRVCNGVIDHCRLVNSYGDPGYMDYENRTLDYGIGLRRWASDTWNPDVWEVLGKYTYYTVVIENNYFTKWRHGAVTNDGFHQVFRYNVVEGGYGIGETDSHGSYAEGIHPYAVGTRALEVYGNIFKNPDTTWTNQPWAINHRGGGGLFYDNILEGYYGLCHLNNDWGNYVPYCPKCHIYDTYIWNNILNGAYLISYNSDNVENVNYFLRTPNIEQDGWEYIPYTYP